MIYNKNLVINDSTKQSGYISIKSNKTGKQKIRIIKDGITYTYNIGNEFEIFPLQMGDGLYTIKLYVNVSAKKYYTDGFAKIDVKLKNGYCPYLYGNQYVDCSFTDIINESRKLFGELSIPDKISSVKKYITTEYEYDYIKAFLIKIGELPDIKRCYENKMGVCQDLAGLTAVMLRSIGIPCKLVIGYADNMYHAWNEILIDGEWEIFDPTKAIQGSIINSYSKERWY